MSTERPGDEQELFSVLKMWSAALLKKDLDALGSCYSDGVTVFDIGTPLVGCDQLRVLWEA